MRSVELICSLIIELFVFSCLGWLMEVALKYRQYHRFINRGYLIGPYCPIYGCGVVTITVFVSHLIRPGDNNAEIFLAGMMICGVWEYFVSWAMEKLFHARWWDYSTKPMNLHGRIWIGNLVVFGLASVFVVKWVNPRFFGWLEKWPRWLIITSAVCIVVILLVDNIVSAKMMNIVKHEIDARLEDNTEEITKKVRELLRSRKRLVRRISIAYPHFQARPIRLREQLKMDSAGKKKCF